MLTGQVLAGVVQQSDNTVGELTPAIFSVRIPCRQCRILLDGSAQELLSNKLPGTGHATYSNTRSNQPVSSAILSTYFLFSGSGNSNRTQDTGLSFISPFFVHNRLDTALAKHHYAEALLNPTRGD